MTASSMTDSGSTFASDSTINTAFFVPATTRSRDGFRRLLECRVENELVANAPDTCRPPPVR